MRQTMARPVRSPWPYLAAYPPIKVRLLAQVAGGRYHRAITNAEIAIAGGFTLERVEEISRLEDWDSLTFDEYRRFCGACRFDPLITRDRNRVNDYSNKCLKRKTKPFQWLTRSPAYQTEFLPLIRQLNGVRSPAQHVA